MLGHDQQSRFHEFDTGDSEHMKKYRPGPTWLPGKVLEVIGSSVYTVL